MTHHSKLLLVRRCGLLPNLSIPLFAGPEGSDTFKWASTTLKKENPRSAFYQLEKHEFLCIYYTLLVISNTGIITFTPIWDTVWISLEEMIQLRFGQGLWCFSLSHDHEYITTGLVRLQRKLLWIFLLFLENQGHRLSSIIFSDWSNKRRLPNAANGHHSSPNRREALTQMAWLSALYYVSLLPIYFFCNLWDCVLSLWLSV